MAGAPMANSIAVKRAQSHTGAMDQADDDDANEQKLFHFPGECYLVLPTI